MLKTANYSKVVTIFSHLFQSFLIGKPFDFDNIIYQTVSIKIIFKTRLIRLINDKQTAEIMVFSKYKNFKTVK